MTRVVFVAVAAASLSFASLLLSACPTAVTPVDGGDVPLDGGTDEPVVCEDRFDCDERSLCEGGLCVDVGGDGCVSRDECPQGEVCVGGACDIPPTICASSEECPAPEVCDGFTQRCFDPGGSGCTEDNDCAFEPGCSTGCTCESDGTCLAGTPPVGDDIDLSGFILQNWEHDPVIQTTVLPDGITLAAGEMLIIARDASRSTFESHWGVTLASNVVYLDANAGSSGAPIVNGDESFALLSPLGTVVDGPTAVGDKDACIFRQDAGDASNPNNWAIDDLANAEPNSNDLPATGVGLVISQWCDTPGGSNDNEFVQLYYAP